MVTIMGGNRDRKEVLLPEASRADMKKRERKWTSLTPDSDH